MDNKSSTGNFVVYTNRHINTAAPKPASTPSTAQKVSNNGVNGYSNFLSCTTGSVIKNSF
ncbi:hypothetical protein OUHCRE10_13310 [Enterobacter hormaechei subsp. xiangfangensis]|jgi:hypothetical protein